MGRSLGAGGTAGAPVTSSPPDFWEAAPEIDFEPDFGPDLDDVTEMRDADGERPAEDDDEDDVGRTIVVVFYVGGGLDFLYMHRFLILLPHYGLHIGRLHLNKHML